MNGMKVRACCTFGRLGRVEEIREEVIVCGVDFGSREDLDWVSKMVVAQLTGEGRIPPGVNANCSLERVGE